MAVDWTDPCARANALRGAYYTLLSGAQEQEIRTRTLDAEEVVRFNAADKDALLVELTAAESECARCTGQPDPNRRFRMSYRELIGGRHRRHHL